MIVGITGTLGAGKGNLVKALQEAGFNHFSVRGFLTQQLKANGKPVDRDHLVGLANELRAKHSPSYIAEQLFEQAQEGRSAVIESLRTPGEVKALKDKDEFYLIAVDAPINDRYERVTTERKSSTDNVTFEEFEAQEAREMASTDPTKQNIGKCMTMADYFFWSDFPTAKDARDKFTSGKSGFLNLLEKKARRPTFPEMFMRSAYQLGSRSTCLRRQTGAVIIDPTDNTEISQGYNGGARKTVHCEDRGGCLRQKQGIPSGEQLDKCYAAHAENNAIWNAGRNGKPVVGMTMFATNYPCKGCSIGIVQSGVEQVIHLDTYSSKLSEDVLSEAGVKVEKYHQGVHPKAFSRFWG